MANCSDECPVECSTLTYTLSLSMASFPKPAYYYTMMARSSVLASRYFNMTKESVAQALISNRFDLLPDINQVRNTLDGKTVALNVYYDHLAYFYIEESPKMSFTDLISGNTYHRA